MTVAIMRFWAGPSRYAIAAGCVEGIGPARRDVPHLALLLGATVARERDTRTLTLVARGHRGEVTVDGPVEFLELKATDVAPCRTTASTTLLGFARVDGSLYGLLDAERVVALTRESAIGVAREGSKI